MVAIRIKTVIGKDRKLVVQLPDEIPPGSVVSEPLCSFRLSSEKLFFCLKLKVRVASQRVQNPPLVSICKPLKRFDDWSTA